MDPECWNVKVFRVLFSCLLSPALLTSSALPQQPHFASVHHRLISFAQPHTSWRPIQNQRQYQLQRCTTAQFLPPPHLPNHIQGLPTKHAGLPFQTQCQNSKTLSVTRTSLTVYSTRELIRIRGRTKDRTRGCRFPNQSSQVPSINLPHHV